MTIHRRAGLAFALSVSMSVAIACYPQPRGCEGCLNEQQICLRGISDSACGSFGQACVACGPSHACQEGACVPVTGPGTPDAGTVADAGLGDGGPGDAGPGDAGPGDAGPTTGFQIVPSSSLAVLRDVAAVSPTEAYAVGSRGTILRWDGRSWSAISSPTDLDLYSVTLAEGEGWAVGGGGVCLSLRNGTWSVYSPPLQANVLRGVSAVSARSAMAVGKLGEQLYTFTWNGSQWTGLAVGAPHPYTHLTDVFLLPDGTAFASQDTAIMKWKGTYWEQLTTPTTNTLEGIWASSADEAFAVGSTGMLMRWNSRSGRELYFPPAPYTWFRAVWGSSPTDIWAVGGGGRIMHWNGHGWMDVPSPTTQDLYGVSGSGPQDVWIVGNGGTILHGP